MRMKPEDVREIWGIKTEYGDLLHHTNSFEPLLYVGEDEAEVDANYSRNAAGEIAEPVKLCDVPRTPTGELASSPGGVTATDTGHALDDIINGCRAALVESEASNA